MKTIYVILITLVATVSSQAAFVFSDSFDYPDGDVVANSGGVWIQNTGTAGTCLVTNKQLQIASSLSEDIVHQLPTFATNGTVSALYASFSVKFTQLPTAAGTYFAHFTGTNAFQNGPPNLSGFHGRLWASTTNAVAGISAASGQFFLSVANSGLGFATNDAANPNGYNGFWPTPLDTNVTYTVVVKYIIGTGISTLWIDPTSEDDTHVTATDIVPNDIGSNGFPTNGVINIDHYSFRQNSGEGTMLIDDLKIGTAFNDVAGANTAPTISPIADQNTPANTTTTPIAFTINDAETAAGDLILSNASSNPVLVPTSGISFGGSDENRTVTITPAAGQQGSSVITIFVSDGVNVSSTSFTLTVGAPSISTIPNQITYANQSVGPISFTVSDAENDPLTVTETSSNPSLIPSGAGLGGSGASRTITLTPVTDQTGVSTITLSVSDGFSTNSTSFVVSVSPKYGVIFADNFNYVDFTVPNALVGAFYDAGETQPSLWETASGTPYQVQVVGNDFAELNYTNSEDVAAVMTNSPFAADSGIVLYTSFTVNFTNLPSQAGNYFAHFKDAITGSTFRDKIFASTSNAVPGMFRIGIANAANNFTAQFPQDLNTNQTYLIVTRYNSGTGESVLWINPANEGSTSVAAQDPTTASIVGAYGLREDTGIGVVDINNLVIGTSFSDVATVTVTPIPLNIQSGGGNVVLTWNDPSFSLQSSANINGPYTTISGASSGFTTNTSNAQMFFRLVH
ncbi:MAG TPA: hypothetical protein VHG89_08815 [Verrucomicrobiae bacterium]|nr:hypothetical protein [Verrucomicrobiae bacterium]